MAKRKSGPAEAGEGAASLAQGASLPEVGPWATDKLGRLSKYLSAYTTIMSNQRRWCHGYVYVDAFAGAGTARLRHDGKQKESGLLVDAGAYLRQDHDARELINGSPRIALETVPGFTHYVFLERDEDRSEALQALVSDYPGKQIAIRRGDCNQYLKNKLVDSPKVDWKSWRGVVFLDPFGMQVPWGTIRGIASTRALEVFINFPVGMAIQRLLKRSGDFSKKERAKLDDYFGDPGWFDVVYPRTKGLFGDMRHKTEDSSRRLVNWYRGRLKQAFGHVSTPYLVRNSRGGHLYYLIFAGPNPSGAKIATYVLQGGSRSTK